ncbi:DedA family protein [Sphingobium subterraneum]|uniref:Membrane protein DedA with SNARE-associated domain n=1 Tax=Sphingobium subterraneum TaxID=627688 RepID=A0A841IVJ8_9SPHN|nr:DedA family protein [Sphingobium subterraneum]MBB6122364.1 membrane protein DedA with SNARE-associated domain [Sphingobium subterraneum]
MTDWVLHLIDAGGYWGIFALMVLENIFPPIPSELIMGVGGIRVGQGRMELIPLLISGTIGTTIGNYAWFMVGWKLGVHRLRPLVDRYGRWATIEWSDVEAINRLFERYGQMIVFVLRFMPTFRTMVSLPAGLFRMGHIRFLLWTAAGALIWNIVLAGAGYYLGANFKKIDDYVGPAATVTVVVIAIAYVWRLMTWKPSGKSAD